MRHASIFTGIGGFDLAAEWMGWDNVFQVEIDQFCQKVLSKNFPNTIKYGDIKGFDGSKYRGTIDVLSGGFPCQPYSTAGKRKGKDDERHLWPEMLRVIRGIQPPWVVGENVRGLTSWNGGVVFDEVQADLEAAGYTVTPFLLPAAGVNAPHRRDRIWFIAHADKYDDGKNYNNNQVFSAPETIERATQRAYGKRMRPGSGNVYKINSWGKFPAQSPICGGDAGVSDWLDRIIVLGNAVVPQVVYHIFKAIEEYETLLFHSGTSKKI